MILSTKLVNLLGILAIGSISLEVAVAVDEFDDTLQQALFLVKLLKLDIAQILRTKYDDVVANSTEEENSTCSLPSEEFNSTMAMNETEVTTSPVSPSTPATPPPPMPEAPPVLPNVMPSGARMMMPYASWPSEPMGYPQPSGPGRQNFPDENYRFPYRLNRRRMMPDYYYFDSPAKSRGNFRRFGNDPADDLGNTPATSQAQTTSSQSTGTSEATTLHMEVTTASTSPLPTTLAQPSTPTLPTTEQPTLRTTISANHTILTTADSAKEPIPADTSHQTILTTTAISILSTATSTKQSIIPRTEEPNLPTIKLTKQPKHRKRVRHRTRLPVTKAMTSVMSTRNEKLNVNRHHLRHKAHNTTTTEKGIIEDVEMSQVASELEKEFEGTNFTNTEDTHESYKDGQHLNLKKIKKKKTTTTPRTTTTMKVFLQGSSKIPIPFPENNGFCHFHPENSLCGAI